MTKSLAKAAALACAIGACNLNAGSPSEPYDSEGGDGSTRPGDGTTTTSGVALPEFGTTVVQPVPPPPISGGTMAVTPDHRLVIASDPDRDRVYVVDIASGVVAAVELMPREEPGRVAVDDDGRAYVVLRGAGALLTLDIATRRIVERRAVCTAPRGVAFDAVIGSVHVACADGQLVTLPVATGAATQRLNLGRDLRDVVPSKDGLWVSKFRSATVMRVSRDGMVVTHIPRVLITNPGTGSTAQPPNLAWRMIAAPPGGTSDAPIISSQQPTDPSTAAPSSAYYGAPPAQICALASVAGRIDAGSSTGLLPEAVLPVDIAATVNEYVIVAAGNAYTQRAQLIRVEPYAMRNKVSVAGCVESTSASVPGQPIAVAFAGSLLLVQSREPAVLHVMTPKLLKMRTITLATESREDTGHAIFHSSSGSQVACASCHAEGGEDGRIWEFPNIGRRRTPSLRGTVANTEPFHWDGKVKNMAELVEQVFVGKMAGPYLSDAQTDALKTWLYAIPAPPALATASQESITRGSQLFETRGCSTCHAGAKLTRNSTEDVGTGGLFQVPSLVGVGWRPPFLHDGCAQTLDDRFGKCGGVRHGDTRNLTEADIHDFVAFLETL